MAKRTLVNIFYSCLALLILSSCTVGRFFIYNFADVKDYKKFPSRTLNAPEEAFTFHEVDSMKGPKSVTVKGVEVPWGEFLEENKTVAFMIIRNDSILYEEYFNKYDETSIVPSFSMAKSVTSMLIGCAIEDGLIASVNDPVANYIPEMAENGFDKVTIEHVLQMTTGLDFNESYVNPFGTVAKFYYGRNLPKYVRKLELEAEPGTRWQYVSGDTQILVDILDGVLTDETVTQYLERKIWQPLGMEYDASWSLDKKDGIEKGFCCINARARDFAKLGRLYLNNGNWDGTQIVPEAWVEKSTAVDTTNKSVWFYQYQWWKEKKNDDFYAEGILGQFVYVSPDNNFIAVRLGKNYGEVSWSTLMQGLSEKY
ncbi:MAG: serine hydrolase [Bacteroidota bacterium]